MAAADYRLCDCCDGKVFYDSNLNYEYDEVLPSGHMALDYLGDWAVICSDCAKTHKTVVLTNEQAVQLAAAPAIAAPTEVERVKALQVARAALKTADYAIKGREHTGFINNAIAAIDAAIATGETK